MRRLVAETTMKRVTRDVSSFTVVVEQSDQDIDEFRSTNPFMMLRNKLKNSIILDQVENGVAIRMAVLYLLAARIPRTAV